METLVAYLKGHRDLVGAVGAFVAGLFIGLVVLGWNIWPVQYYDTDPVDLKPSHKETYVILVADSFALNQDAEKARERLRLLEDPELDATVSRVAVDLRNQGKAEEAARLSQLAQAVAGGEGVPGAEEEATPVAQAPDEQLEEGGSFWGRLSTVCGVLVFLLLIGVGGYLAFLFLGRTGGLRPRRRASRAEPGADLGLDEEYGDYAPTEEPLAEVEGAGASVGLEPEDRTASDGPSDLQPLGRFSTTFTLGDEDFDSSFDIETSVGEFLGQCGIGASEILDESDPQKVVAFEVWLFDKSDVRTVSKLVVSDYAYQDPVLQDRLSPRGEMVKAQKGDVLLLETARLRVDMQVLDFAYAGGSPPRSYFKSLTAEFAVSGKE